MGLLEDETDLRTAFGAYVEKAGCYNVSLVG